MPTKTDVYAILTKLGDMYPRFDLKDATLEAFYSMLSDIPLDELRAAAAVCASSKEFFPSVHELRAAVADLRIKSQNIPTANEAFIETSLAKAGHDWTHEIVKQVAYEMGWQYGIFPTDSTIADRSQFIKAYDAAVNKLVWSETVIPGVLAHIESQRPAPMLPWHPELPIAHLSDDSAEEYVTLREAMGSETVAAISARLKAKASEGKP